jgi:hypothetical protein
MGNHPLLGEVLKRLASAGARVPAAPRGQPSVV